MTARSPFMFSQVVGRPTRSTSDRSLETFPPERRTVLPRRRGGFLSVPGKLAGKSGGDGGSSQKMVTRLLLNVNIERSLGPVHVVMSSENTVRELVKAAIEIYVKEKRRPLLKVEIVDDPDRFELHYSQFSLESLKPDEKLINLGSRIFFLCSRPSNSSNVQSCVQKAGMANKSLFALMTKLMELLL